MKKKQRLIVDLIEALAEEIEKERTRRKIEKRQRKKAEIMAEKSRVMLVEQLNKDTSTVANEQRAAFEQRERDLLETIREKE